MKRIATSVFFAAALALGVGATVRAVTPAVASPTASLPTPSSLAGLTDGTVSAVAERVVESVVNISSTRQVEVAGPAMWDPWFNDPRSPFFSEPSDRQQTSMGSGVLVTEQGRILTNAHVIQGADEITVTLHDGVEVDAKVVGVDERSDLAVIQLKGALPKLKALPLGDSGALRLGEVVLAVGNPFGVGQAVTMGIVSAKGRAAVGIVDYEDFIQTDAAINPGNSGGALVNLRGELIGINTAILSRSGGYQGIGFAIPTAMAKPISDMLVRDGKVVRGFLGIDIATVDKKLAAEKNLATQTGVLIASVGAGSPAAKAGVKAGDVVVALNGSEIRDAARLRNAIAMAGANKLVQLEILRGTSKLNIKASTGVLETAKKKRMQRRPTIRIR